MIMEKDGIVYVTAPEGLIRTPHAFVGRSGGVSPHPFCSLNAARTVGDAVENVEKNMGLIADSFGFDKKSLVTVRQVHSDKVLVLDEMGASGHAGVEADAIVTARKGTPIGVLTADCLPIILVDHARGVIGIVHAGWRGTLKGVTLKAVEAMRTSFGTDPADLVAAIGPAIGPCCYTVNDDVAEGFKGAFGNAGGFIEGGGPYRVNLREANRYQLVMTGVGVEKIAVERSCTSCRNDLFFSYRKDGGTTGRQLSFVMQ